jgi:polyhydroxybutyrate depolymerase
VADREGFALVFPGGTGETDDALTWNAGPDCCGYATLFDVDDVGYVEAVLRHLEARHPVDRSRLYVTGHSNGAMMSYRLAAELPELWAGVVGVAGAMQVPAMAPAGPVPVLHVHSVDDPRAFYDGGTRDDRSFAPVDSMLVRWAGANGCPGEPQPAQELVGTGLDVGHTATLLRWSCASAALEHWKLTGAGHPWPGHQVAPAWEAVVGPSTEIIDAASEIFAFVRRTSSR